MADVLREYLLPAEQPPASVAAAVAAEVGATLEAPRRERAALLDTFDRRVQAAGGWITVTRAEGHEPGHPTLVWRALDTGRPLGSVPLEGEGGASILARDLPPGPLRDRLAPVLDVRALIPLADVDSEVHTAAVRNDDGKCVARVVVEVHRVAPPGSAADGPRTALPGRLRVVPVRGYDRARRRVERAVERAAPALGLVPAGDDVSTAVLAAVGAPDGAGAGRRPALDLAQPAAAAWVALLRSLLGAMGANEAGTKEGVDPEFLHDFRVALRRSRSALRHAKGVLPEPLRACFRPELRWLQRETGPARDLDVWVIGLEADLDALSPDDAVALAPFERLLRGRRAEAHAHVVDVLEGERYRSLVEDWAATLEDLAAATGEPDTSEAGEWGEWPEDAARPVGEVAATRLRRQYHRVVDQGSAITDESPDTDLHELRKAGKELRYILDLFGPVLPVDSLGSLARDLKALQEDLGTFQDTAVQLEALQHFADDLLAEGPQASSAILALAPMVERIRRRQVEAREDFARRFAKVASASTRRRVDALP